MQKDFDKMKVTATAWSRFPPVTFNSDSSELLCSPEHGKLCFEALETEFSASKQLALAGSKKNPPKSAFRINYKWISDE
ncbi:hypothetical protein M2306_001319 [Myroides gitamensis]|nr:hypothetical protein [Myroides odoratus]MDH6600625.1 hypothetical protein [Myroides gitamensis]